MKKVLFLLLMPIAFTNVLLAQKPNNTMTQKIGNFEIVLLSEGQQKGNTGILIGTTPEMLQQSIPNGDYPNATNAFLVRTPGKNVLVDAGYGRELLNNLQLAGIAAAQIDAILITHMHGDHIGGLLNGDKVVFPNADLYIAQPEHDYWTSREEMQKVAESRRGGFVQAQKVVAAYKNKLHLFAPAAIESPAANLFPGFSGIAAYGHTPGHTAYLLESNNARFVIWGDLTHAMAIQMPYPQVAVTYDVAPTQAVEARAQLLKFVSENKIPIAGMHIAFPGMGSVEAKKDGGYTFKPSTAR